MKRLVSFLLCALLSAVCFASDGGYSLQKASPESMGMDSAKLSRVDEAIDKAISEGSMPGAVLAVVRGDKLVYLKAYGNKSVVPHKEAMTTRTVFDLASVSKCVGTTLSFMQLVESGKVRLTDNVNRYIEGFQPWEDPQTGDKVDITIRDLMTHTSGLSPYVDVNELVSKYGEDCPDSLMSYIATKVRRNFRPGTQFMYSCLNFVTLQNILQRITGEKLSSYAQEHVFNVLGLQHTCYNPSGETLKLCAPTEVQKDGKPLLGVVHDPLSRRLNGGISGNAGVFSDAEDLSVVCAAIMNGGAIGGRRILSPLTVQTMVTVPADMDPKIGRALGWDCWSDYSLLKGDIFNPHSTICHTGYTGPSIVISLDTKTAVILLAHRVHPEDKGSMGRIRALVTNIVAGSIIDPSVR